MSRESNCINVNHPRGFFLFFPLLLAFTPLSLSTSFCLCLSWFSFFTTLTVWVVKIFIWAGTDWIFLNRSMNLLYLLKVLFGLRPCSIRVVSCWILVINFRPSIICIALLLFKVKNLEMESFKSDNRSKISLSNSFRIWFHFLPTASKSEVFTSFDDPSTWWYLSSVLWRNPEPSQNKQSWFLPPHRQGYFSFMMYRWVSSI